ncbi:MAG TPA: penicillin-insensitive murein endopeptidase [Polyangiaceae bacterium]
MERGSTLILRRNFVTRLRGSSLAAAVVACSVGIVAVASYAGSPAGSEADSRVIVRPARALPAPGRNPRPALERGTVELAPVTIAPEPHPLDGVPATELKRWIIQEPDRLGPVIVGRPNRGALLNAIAMEDGANLQVMHPERSFGTAVTVRSIEAAAERVRREFSNCTPLRVGDISRKRGGYLRPHRSHQSGIDADLGYYYMRSEKWYTVADADTLDRACTWALVKALIAGGNVEYIFMDRSVQVLLELHALRSGEDPGWLDELFEASRKQANRRALVRHTWGHRTHLHVRFHDHVAEETGARAGKLLKRAGKL